MIQPKLSLRSLVVKLDTKKFHKRKRTIILILMKQYQTQRMLFSL